MGCVMFIRTEVKRSDIDGAEGVLIDNGIPPDEAMTVLQAIGYVLLGEELYPEDEDSWDE